MSSDTDWLRSIFAAAVAGEDDGDLNPALTSARFTAQLLGSQLNPQFSLRVLENALVAGDMNAATAILSDLTAFEEGVTEDLTNWASFIHTSEVVTNARRVDTYMLARHFSDNLLEGTFIKRLRTHALAAHADPKAIQEWRSFFHKVLLDCDHGSLQAQVLLADLFLYDIPSAVSHEEEFAMLGVNKDVPYAAYESARSSFLSGSRTDDYTTLVFANLTLMLEGDADIAAYLYRLAAMTGKAIPQIKSPVFLLSHAAWLEDVVRIYIDRGNVRALNGLLEFAFEERNFYS